MNLPKEYWKSNIQYVPVSVKTKVATLLSKIDKANDEGIRVIILGNQYVGKSSIAALIMKESRALGKTSYFTTFWELRDNIRDGTSFDDSHSVFLRCKTVDVLVLDNLREEDVSEKIFLNIRAVEELIAHRRSKQLMTVVTSRLPREKLIAKEFKGFMDAMAGSIFLNVEGENLRAKQEAAYAKEFLGGK
jgi:DNA replication protein DnaC